MTKLAIGIALILGACGGNDVIKEFEGFKDKMCECPDAACGNKVLEDWREWRKKQAKPADSDKAKIKEIDHAFHECEHKVGAGS